MRKKRIHTETDNPDAVNLPIKQEPTDVNEFLAVNLQIKSEPKDEEDRNILNDTTSTSELTNSLNDLSKCDSTETISHARKRVPYSSAQLVALEKKYKDSHFIGFGDRSQLADALNLTQKQVKIWFQNRRAKDKRLEASSKKRPWHSRWATVEGNSSRPSVSDSASESEHGEEGDPVETNDVHTRGVADEKLGNSRRQRSTKLRRKRTAFTAEQLKVLEKTFHNQKYVTSVERKKIAKKLTLDHLQVQIWFQNRRARAVKAIESAKSAADESLLGNLAEAQQEQENYDCAQLLDLVKVKEEPHDSSDATDQSDESGVEAEEDEVNVLESYCESLRSSFLQTPVSSGMVAKQYTPNVPESTTIKVEPEPMYHALQPVEDKVDIAKCLQNQLSSMVPESIAGLAPLLLKQLDNYGSSWSQEIKKEYADITLERPYGDTSPATEANQKQPNITEAKGAVRSKGSRSCRQRNKF